MRARALGLALALAAGTASAQLLPPDPDWQESDVPAPPPVRTQGLVPLDMGRGTDLRWGVDPQSISISRDHIVRYVVVAQGEGGALNASYEGIKCESREVRVYARQARDGAWTPAKAEWKRMDGTGSTRHSAVVAQSGACMGHGANTSAAQVARDLAAANISDRYQTEMRR